MPLSYNGLTDSFNASEETISGANSSIKEDSFEESFHGFEKIPQVCIERLDTSKFIKLLEKIKEREGSKQENNDLSGFTRDCSVRLVRNDLNTLKDLLKNLHNLKCDICLKAYTSEKKLKKHKENKHLLVLDKKPPKRVSFSDKVTVHKINEYHRCRKCSKIFKFYSTLKFHMRREHKKRKCYICYYCTKKFVDRMFFKVHIKLHCDSCGQFLMNKHRLIEHKRKVCKVFQKYKCKRCQDVYFSYMALQDHLYSHGTALICDICKEHFMSKCSLAYHIKLVHSTCIMDLYTFNFGKYHCNYCNYESAVEQDIIEKHVLHLPELNKSLSYRMYPCDLCKETFPLESQLLKHKWTHYLDESKENTKASNNFKYKVGDPLPEHFKPEVVLNRIKIPEKIKPLDYIELPIGMDTEIKKAVIDPITKKTLISKHQCDICTKYFSNRYGLRRHLAKVHKTDNLKCFNCEEVFAWPSLLQTHNCIRNNIPDPPFSDARPEIYLQESEDFVEIPPPIVELTVYEECVIEPFILCDDAKSPTYHVAMLEEVPIEF